MRTKYTPAPWCSANATGLQNFCWEWRADDTTCLVSREHIIPYGILSQNAVPSHLQAFPGHTYRSLLWFPLKHWFPVSFPSPIDSVGWKRGSCSTPSLARTRKIWGLCPVWMRQQWNHLPQLCVEDMRNYAVYCINIQWSYESGAQGSG